MKLKRIFGVLSASVLLGTCLVLASASTASAAVSVTTTNCSAQLGGNITFSVTNVALNDQLIVDFVNSGGDAVQTENVVVTAPGLVGSTYTTSVQVGTAIWLPMTSAGVVSGLLSVRVNGGTSTIATFSVTGCLGLRKVVLEKKIVGGIAPLGSQFKVTFQRNGFNLYLTYTNTGGTYTLPYSAPNDFTVIETSNGGASGSSMFDKVRNVLGSDATHISGPPDPGDEHIQIINSFITRPVSVSKVWKDVNGNALTAAQESKVLSNTLVIHSTTVGGQVYGADTTCTFVSCPFFDVPPGGSLVVVSESDAAGYSLVSGIQSVAGCSPQVNVGSSEFPDFQWPACSVTFVNLANVVTASTTTTSTTTTSSSTTTSTPTSTSIPASVTTTTTTTIPGATTTIPELTTTTVIPSVTTTSSGTVATTTTPAATVTTSSTLATIGTTKPGLVFPTEPTVPPVVFSTIPSAPTPTAAPQSLFVPGTTVARLIVDAAKANLPIPPAPGPAELPIVETTPAYTGSSATTLLLIALGFLSVGAALLRGRLRLNE